MKGYKAVGYAVIDKFGERLCDCLTRDDCMKMIAQMKWQETMIVKTLKLNQKPVRRQVMAVLSPKPIHKSARQPTGMTGKKRVYCIHKSGVEYSFDSVKRVAAFFGVGLNAVYNAVKLERYIQSGPMKDWLITRKEVG
ncbi:hypothetical protein NHG32_07025 [Aerococcaceae bacterium NML191219]|nr:hypothetical protein [Aerococcaceae bacterium NML191219]